MEDSIASMQLFGAVAVALITIVNAVIASVLWLIRNELKIVRLQHVTKDTCEERREKFEDKLEQLDDLNSDLAMHVVKLEERLDMVRHLNKIGAGHECKSK